MSLPAGELAESEAIPRLLFGRPAPEPLRFSLHGVGGDHRTWAAQRDLASQGIRLIGWDARGYGRSEQVSSFTFDELRDDLIRLLDHFALEQAVLIGHSMGGLIAQHFYAAFPHRVRALVLTASTKSLARSMSPRQIEAFLSERRQPLLSGKTMSDLAPHIAPLLIGSAATPKIIEQIVEMMGGLDGDHYLRALEAVTRYEGVLDLSRVQVPTLVVVGEKDTLTPPRAAADLARLIPGAQYKEFSGVGHMVPMEAPALFNEELKKFMRAVHSAC